MFLKDSITDNTRDKIISFAILPIVFSSFFMQYYVHIIKSYVLYMLIILAAAGVIGFVALDRLKSSVKTMCGLWYAAIVCVAVNIVRTEFDLNVYVDLVTFLCCAVMLACTGSRRILYTRAAWVIVGFSVYFAVSIWYQMLFPQQYEQCFLQYLPDKPKYVIMNLVNTGEGFTGFSTNPGYTAGHLAAGILMVFAYTVGQPVRTGRFAGGCGLLSFLLISMFMTGKRAPCVFLAVILVAILFVTLDRKQRVSAMKIGLAAGAVGLLVLVIFWKQLRQIPLIARLFETAVGLISGEDVSNNRAILYEFGGKLFRMNPLFGVGWCNFRRMGAGVITQQTELEAHNIYLQLVCETGIVGAAVILTPIAAFLFKTYRALEAVLKSREEKHARWKVWMIFSFGYQLYFLVNGTMDNLLYDHNYVIIYFVALSMFMSYHRMRRNKRSEKRNSSNGKRKKHL